MLYFLLMKRKELINLSFRINRLILKNGKLSKISLLTDRIGLSLTKEVKKKNPLIIFYKAVENIMPFFLLKNKRIGKRIIISPSFILSIYYRQSLGIKWLIEAALNKKGCFYDNFILEILEAYNNKGSVKRRQKDLNTVVLDNKSNLKYRW